MEPLLDRELERRHLDDERLVRRSRAAVVNGMADVAARDGVDAGRPADTRASIPVVVVLPFVPVTAR